MAEKKQWQEKTWGDFVRCDLSLACTFLNFFQWPYNNQVAKNNPSFIHEKNGSHFQAALMAKKNPSPTTFVCTKIMGRRGKWKLISGSAQRPTSSMEQ